jgi:hypothetical protein
MTLLSPALTIGMLASVAATGNLWQSALCCSTAQQHAA